MRAILRVSISGENTGTLRNKLKGIAEKHKFRTDPGGANTGTWQNHAISEQQYADFLAEYWKAIATHDGEGKIDHIWSMIDRWTYPQDIDAQIDDEVKRLGVVGAGEEE